MILPRFKYESAYMLLAGHQEEHYDDRVRRCLIKKAYFGVGAMPEQFKLAFIKTIIIAAAGALFCMLYEPGLSELVAFILGSAAGDFAFALWSVSTNPEALPHPSSSAHHAGELDRDPEGRIRDEDAHGAPA